MGRQVHIYSDLAAVSEAALKRIRKRLDASEGRFRIALAGGSTPRELYTLMADAPLDWGRFDFWWGDERFVPHDHKDSNYRMAREALLDHLELSEDQVHPWPYLDSAEASAEEYQSALAELFPEGRTFDLVLLGMGDDGHTASLFPDTRALEETERLAVANYVKAHDSWRLTVTYPALERAGEVVFLVCGKAKAAAMDRVINQGKLPSARVLCQGDTLFFVDREAAARLS